MDFLNIIKTQNLENVKGKEFEGRVVVEDYNPEALRKQRDARGWCSNSWETERCERSMVSQLSQLVQASCRRCEHQAAGG